jgi:hypothetical protein
MSLTLLIFVIWFPKGTRSVRSIKNERYYSELKYYLLVALPLKVFQIIACHHVEELHFLLASKTSYL